MTKSAENKAKELEGKAQEKIGEATGDTSMELKGKAKQFQASVEQMADDAKAALGQDEEE